MSTWAKKIEENWFLEILQSKGFVQEKKLLKNLYIYSYLLESFHISCLVSIQVEKNFSVQMLKSLFIEIYPFFKHTQHHLLILPSPPSEEIKKLAQELNLGTTDLPSLLLSLFPAEHYQDYLKRQFVFKHYSSPWLYQNHSRVEYNHFIKRLRENKEGLIVLEGEKGIGKTTLSQYFTYELGCSISSSTDNWLIPFFISLSNLKKEMTVQKFIEYQIFHPDMLAPLTKKNFELLLKHHRIILIIDSIEQVGLNSFAILEEIWDCLLQYIQAGAKIILTTPLDYLFFQYQKQVGIKYYFEQFLSQISVERYQLRPLTLLQIKQYNHENPKFKSN